METESAPYRPRNSQSDVPWMRHCCAFLIPPYLRHRYGPRRYEVGCSSRPGPRFRNSKNGRSAASSDTWRGGAIAHCFTPEIHRATDRDTNPMRQLANRDRWIGSNLCSELCALLRADTVTAGRPAQVFSPRSGGSDAGLHTLPNYRPLELGDCHQDMQLEPRGRICSCGIDCLIGNE